MEFDFGILEGKGISVTEGISYTGSSEKYVSALQRYFRGYESNKKTLEDFLSAGDMEGYSIKAHSLKSNSRMIGASALGGIFEELELAAKEGNAKFVASRTKNAMELYGRVIEAIRPFGEMEKVTASDEISAEEAKETAQKLLEALDDFDDELSAALAAKLEGYPFRITQRQKLKEAAGYISDFSYDEAAELIKEIIPAIE
ncbi:MAG: Hpt domain-containing protein [Lachnospiraceae bacterium]|nr:Hpt domain-containing protein [Lachnospiraceae bacterium]